MGDRREFQPDGDATTPVAGLNSDDDPMDDYGLRVSTIVRAVVWGQILWTIGFSLTTGGFFTYFAYEIGAKEIPIAFILVVPEIAGIFGIFSRAFTRWLGNRKRVYVWFSLVARAASLIVPLIAVQFIRDWLPFPIWILIASLAVTNIFQAIAYTAYISWLSDLVPEYNWGRLFARRSLAKVGILIFVPMAGAFARDYWKNSLGAEETLWVYIVVFSVGTLFLTLSLLPMLRLPAVETRTQAAQNTNDGDREEVGDTVDSAHEPPSTLQQIQNAFANRNTRLVILYSWWLAFFQGITQTPIFFYSVGELKISLGTYYTMAGIMYGIQLSLSLPTGHFSDRHGNKRLLIGSLLVVSLAMVFWMLATPENWWWVIGAYMLWGGFAVVNITQRNLLLKVSPRGDNQIQFALFRQVAGLIAGLTGLLGGYVLKQLRTSEFSTELLGLHFTAFTVIFLVSFVGRLLAPLWLLPVRETPGGYST